MIFNRCLRTLGVCLTVCFAAQAYGASREELISEGERALLVGNAIVAERAFVRGVDAFPDDPRFRYYAGIAAYLLDHPDDAELRLDGVTKTFPRALFLLGLIALEDGRAQTAVERLSAYLAVVPRDPEGELLKGIAQLQLKDPEAVQHFNLAANLDADLRSQALFFRGLAQFQGNQREGADKALRAVLQLGEDDRLIDLAEQTLDLVKNRGDTAKRSWGEAHIDVAYDDNLARGLDRGTREAGARSAVRGRYWRELLGDAPHLTVGGWLEHDQPIAHVAGRTGIGLLSDLGWYRALESLSLDPGVEIEPSFQMTDVGGYGLASVEFALRPRLYLYADHERSLKIFYEFGYVADTDAGFLTGLRQRFGLRPSWTGRSRRTYATGLLAYERSGTSADAYNDRALRLLLDAQTRLLKAWLFELGGGYRKAFYRDIDPHRDEDTLIAHAGTGYWNPEKRFVFLIGADQEHHLNSDATRSWRARVYWLRTGAYF